MATVSPRWTKATFLSWFEQHRTQLIDLTTRLFGGELKACGLTAEDALHDTLERSLRKRRYQRCRTTMKRRWFLKDVKWVILDALKKAKRIRTVPLEPSWKPESRVAERSAEMGTSGDDAGQREFAVASDEVDEAPPIWMYCDTFPLQLFNPRRARPSLSEWVSYQLDLRHRVARQPRSRFQYWCGAPYRRPATPATFWPAYRSGGDRLPVKDRDGNLEQRDQRPWKQALRAELWNYRNRLEAIQVEAADIESTISGRLARYISRGSSRNGHQPQPPEPWSCRFAQLSCRVESSCSHRDRVDQPIPAFVFTT